LDPELEPIPDPEPVSYPELVPETDPEALFSSNNLRIFVLPEPIPDPEPVSDPKPVPEPFPDPEPNPGPLFSAIDLRIPVLTKIL
jgi:fused signal recognition particle receptor